MTDDDTSDAVRWQRDVFPSCHLALRLYAFALNVMPWELGDTDTFVSWDALEDVMPYLSKTDEDNVELCAPVVGPDGWKQYSTVGDVIELRSVYTLLKSSGVSRSIHVGRSATVHTSPWRDLSKSNHRSLPCDVLHPRHAEWLESILCRVRYMMFFHHDNIERLNDAFRRGDSLYIVRPKFDIALLGVIESKKQTLSSAHAEYFMYQKMTGLALHRGATKLRQLPLQELAITRIVLTHIKRRILRRNGYWKNHVACRLAIFGARDAVVVVIVGGR